MTILACSANREIEYPFTFVGKKTERGENTMELCTIDSNPNMETLKKFCLHKKQDFSSGMFHYVVFFDAEENAVFPNSPFTTLYGMEEEPKKHIKAIYEFNTINGYSELSFYEVNAWESIAKSVKL